MTWGAARTPTAEAAASFSQCKPANLQGNRIKYSLPDTGNCAV
jgi:hypothetical protein